MTESIRRPKQKLDPAEWKKRLAQALRETGLVPEGFTGAVRVDLSNGGVRSMKREEMFK